MRGDDERITRYELVRREVSAMLLMAQPCCIVRGLACADCAADYRSQCGGKR